MKAMVLAAGVGSRLRPLTDTMPKASVEVAGRSMLEIVLRRLKNAGVGMAVVNTHHYPEQIEALLKANRNFGILVEVSHEPELLDTGGGLRNNASWFENGEPFFVHTADIYTELDLAALYKAHQKSGALATLAVRKRETSRRFLFDDEGRLKGWEDASKDERRWAGEPLPNPVALAFDGVSVCSSALVDKLREPGVFSLTQEFLRLAGQGERIEAFRSDDYYWKDVGSPEKLEALRREAAERGLGF